jgi:phosphate transport system permease protein
MVIGNTYQISPSLFAPATTLASLVASQFREADSEVYLSALMGAAVVLFFIAVVVNVLARLLVWRISTQPVGAATGGA